MEGREVFRIEHRKTQQGVFRACAIGIDWHAFSIPMPRGDGPEEAIDRFLFQSYQAIFAYLSIKSILKWFETSELQLLDRLDFHISVFVVPYNSDAGAFSQTQAVFLRERVQWVRFISLLDL